MIALLLAYAVAIASPNASPSPAPSDLAQTTGPAPKPTASAPVKAQGPPMPFGALGDLGGARTTLQKRGVDLFGRYVGEFAANPSGGLQQGTAYASEFQLGFDVNFNKLESIKRGGTLKFVFTERWGSGLSTNDLGNVGSVQEIYGDALTPRLTELDYDQVLSPAVDVKFGRVIMQNDYAASSTYWGGNLWCNYQSNAICGTPVAAPNNSGYGYYPSSEWGATLKADVTKSSYVQGGAYQVVPLYADRGQGFNLTADGSTGFIFPVETGVTLSDASGAPVGNVRVGGYYETSDVAGWQRELSTVAPAVALGTLDPVQNYRGRDGGWFLFDHLLSGKSDARSRGTAFWFDYEFGDPQTALISNFYDLGVVQHGTFRSRPADTLALGFDEIDFNARLRAAEANLQSLGYAIPLQTQERAFEVNYGIAVAPGIVVRPNFQYVIDPNGLVPGARYPGGADRARNAPVLGLSTSIAF